MKVMNGLNAMRDIRQRVLIRLFEEAQIELRSRLVLLNVANRVVRFHPRHGGFAKVGSHHAHGVGPIEVDGRRGKVEIPIQEQTHKSRLLKISWLRLRVLDDGDWLGLASQDRGLTV